MAAIERMIAAAETTVNIRGTGPTLRLNVNDTVIVHLINEPEPASCDGEEAGEDGEEDMQRSSEINTYGTPGTPCEKDKKRSPR